ncbi:MAG: ASKHA domain-containing protein [Actinomycetota bacterium]
MALSSKYYLEVPAASLDNNKGEIDRINSLLEDFTGIKRIDWPIDLIISSLPVIRSSNGQLTVTACRDGDRLTVISVESGDTRSFHFGIAIDLGTTVVAAELIDLKTGDTLSSEGEINAQVRYGEDLLTRLHFASQGGVNELKSALLDTINKLVDITCKSSGIPSNQISAASIAGNTSMTHLFLGLDPSSIRHEPYVPVVNHVPVLNASEVGLKILPYAPIFIFPSSGSFLGGDLISGVLASGLTKSEKISLLLDIGTNGEMVLGNKDWLLACAGAAGPALEGAVAECATRAKPGAIDRVVIDPTTLEPSFSTIDDKPAIGLCGSGLVDAIAQLYSVGLLDSTGRFVLEKHTTRWQKINHRIAYMLTEERTGNNLPPIYITEKDIQNVLRTKAAMVAALTVLLNSVGISIEEVQKVYTAGSFGIHLSPESSIAIGLYPKLPLNRFIQLGNGSLLGARRVLLDASNIDEAKRIADKITYLELNVHPTFMNLFRSAKYI